MKSNEEIKQWVLSNGYEMTDNINKSIFLLRDGSMISGRIYDGYRIDGHEIIEGLVPEAGNKTDGQSFWNKTLTETGMVLTVPEMCEALMVKDMRYTKEQRQILKKAGFEIELAFEKEPIKEIKAWSSKTAEKDNKK